MLADARAPSLGLHALTNTHRARDSAAGLIFDNTTGSFGCDLDARTALRRRGTGRPKARIRSLVSHPTRHSTQCGRRRFVATPACARHQQAHSQRQRHPPAKTPAQLSKAPTSQTRFGAHTTPSRPFSRVGIAQSKHLFLVQAYPRTVHRGVVSPPSLS